MLHRAIGYPFACAAPEVAFVPAQAGVEGQDRWLSAIGYSFRFRRARGQSVILVALMLPFLVAFVLLVVEVAERWLEVAMVEDALQQSTRSTVQLLDYADLARGQETIRATEECLAVTWDERDGCRPLLRVARQLLITNLMDVRGLEESGAELADQVRWTVLPNGGTCTYSSTAVAVVTATTPLICAEVRPPMRGIVGWGSFAPLIIAADTLEPTQP